MTYAELKKKYTQLEKKNRMLEYIVYSTWQFFDNVLPKDGQQIIILDKNTGDKKRATFCLPFWEKYKRMQCTKGEYKYWMPDL